VRLYPGLLPYPCRRSACQPTRGAPPSRGQDNPDRPCAGRPDSGWVGPYQAHHLPGASVGAVVQQASRHFCTLTSIVSAYNALADHAVKTRGGSTSWRASGTSAESRDLQGTGRDASRPFDTGIAMEPTHRSPGEAQFILAILLTALVGPINHHLRPLRPGPGRLCLVSTADARRAPDLLERRSLVDTGLRPRDDALSEASCGP
jgi:hypothetical protein